MFITGCEGLHKVDERRRGDGWKEIEKDVAMKNTTTSIETWGINGRNNKKKKLKKKNKEIKTFHLCTMKLDLIWIFGFKFFCKNK